ncbi:lipoyl(octanoyl) transferase LipB [Hymenobacter busanensis]|uniref:Octanoyltransferase n=1 Tax=Hymenobacter busanensis TaxID=2607656 RepID=A0A7L5A2E8_9BACT|nr:lipoyl(octanoyl) transferase LipB [Hymenobacter busanensis]KAA9331458.1 lipoyl(octanoyl) transferase LipB [Hymenobacter busanensis]QHJ08612.1 lipoyl(octanoyl) transferase LipB [Hymenobacter busanensis]
MSDSITQPAPTATLAPPAHNRVIELQRLPHAAYVPTWDYQEQLLAETVAVKTRNRQHEAAGTPLESTPNHLLLCEHPPVYTLGKSGKPEHLLLDENGLADHGATFHRINRGGDITFHGPGQLVGYPILDLENFKPDIHWYLRTLEEAVILTLAEYGIVSGRIAGLTGVWLDFEEGASNPRKICAMGVKCSRWVTMHGFALNVNTDLNYFGHIVPCGITDKAVTSLQQELGRAVPLREIEDRFVPHLAQLLDAQIVEKPYEARYTL